MKMNTNLQTVLEIFFNSPTTPLHIRKVARLTHLSPAAVSKFLRELESKELIIKCKEEVTTEYKANRDNEEFKWRKRVNNLQKIYESELINYFSEASSFSTIVLFGSYSQGEDWENSDIDIAIVSKKKIKLNVEDFERKLNRKISMHQISLDQVSAEFKTNLSNGIVLRGYLEI